MSKSRGKGEVLQIVEYVFAFIFISLFRLVPQKIMYTLSGPLGDLLYLALPRRRRIATDNIRHAFKGEIREGEVRRIARKSCQSFFLTAYEVVKSESFYSDPDVREKIKITGGEAVHELLNKARKVHDECGGCIFVTPHIGNWELLPGAAAIADIPVVIVARPLDNRYIERLLFKNRTATGQVIIPKKNAMFVLQRTLHQGKSIAMLTDQSTARGLPVDFFGRQALTTPVPALLAITKKRPIVVVACCRTGDFRFRSYVSDPIWPRENENEKEEILRLTAAMNREMEAIIRKHPEQYLWMHNRWKTYAGVREVMKGA